jgi:hypothetical protein
MNKENCRHLKKLTCKLLLQQVFIRIYRLEIKKTINHVGIFDPSLRTVSLTIFQLSPPPPSVNKYTVYKYTVCYGGGIWSSGPQADKHLPQSPFTGQFF